jgi:hypothetical protein
MRSMTPANKQKIADNQQNKIIPDLNKLPTDSSENNAVTEILSAGGCENFSDYVRDLGLSNDPDLVVLSSFHHYYYDAEEMKNVRTVISIKLLNQVKDIRSFLRSIFIVIPRKSNFIGCFVDNKKFTGYSLRYYTTSSQARIGSDNLENGIVSQIPLINTIYSFIDSKTNKFITARNVSTLLEDHGFKVLDMKEISGITYFHSQKE